MRLTRNSTIEEIIQEIKDLFGDKFSELREEEIFVMIDDIQRPDPPITY